MANLVIKQTKRLWRDLPIAQDLQYDFLFLCVCFTLWHQLKLRPQLVGIYASIAFLIYR